MRNAGSVDQGGVLVQGNPLQRANLAAGAERLCRAFPCRAESPGEGQCSAVSSEFDPKLRGTCDMPLVPGWAHALFHSSSDLNVPHTPNQQNTPSSVLTTITLHPPAKLH